MNGVLTGRPRGVIIRNGDRSQITVPQFRTHLTSSEPHRMPGMTVRSDHYGAAPIP